MHEQRLVVPDGVHRDYHPDTKHLVYLSGPQIEALKELVTLLKELLAEQYQVGSRNGRDILGAMVRGETSIAEFNEQSLRQEQLGARKKDR